MGRPRAKLDQQEQALLVEQRLACEPPGILRERLLAVSHGLKGELSLDEIAQAIGRSRATIQTWFDAFRQGGVSGLCSVAYHERGAKSLLTQEAAKELRKKLAKGSFRRAEDAREWLHQRFGIEAKTNTVLKWLGKFAARLKVVRPRHPQSSDAHRYEFRQQLARRIYKALRESGDRLKGRPLRVWVADEGRFGLQPCLRRAWVTRGVRAHKSSRCEYDWLYVWAALQVGGAGSEFFYSEQADKETSGVFLKQISQRDPYAVHVVIWDGAGFHPSGADSRVPDNVVLVKQPPYSPELNPVEKLWDMLRDGLCNRRWKSLDHLEEQMTRWLKGFWQSPRQISSLIGQGWLLLQTNVCSAPFIPIK